MSKVGLSLAALLVVLVPLPGRGQLLPPVPIAPPSLPDPGTCLGPICLPQLSDLSVGPVEFPTLPSLPLGPTPPPPLPPPAPPGCTSTTLGMKVLVISADGTEPVRSAVEEALDYHSVPYSTWIATQRPGQLTPDALASGCDGAYQGVVLTTGALAYSPDGGATWTSALTSAEWLALRTYEAQFGVREISWYVYPGADQGLNPPSHQFDPGATPYDLTLTDAGKAVFPYVNAANPVPINQAWTYLATPADASVTPLLVDAAGNALVSSRKNADGRETIALTFDSNPYLLHHAILVHGLVEWLTKGVYLGEFRSYLTPQVDDVYLDNDMYMAGSYPGGVYRMTAADVTAMHTWQSGVQALGGNLGFRLAHAFNGSGAATGDPLTLSVGAVNGGYHFINHTWTHQNLDAVSYGTAFDEVALNDAFARNQGFASYATANLVTPDVSGLTNPAALAAMADVGIKYTVSDTSRAGWSNPRPNIGIYSAIEPSILHVPRRPTNLFYNVAAPDEWTSEYNAFYATYWGRNLGYTEILDKESQLLLFYMLRGDLDPQMYHQPNLRAYDGVHSLLGDLHDLAIQKFRRHSKLPIVSPPMHVAGRRMANTMARNTAGVSGRISPGTSVSLTSPAAVQVSVSGVCTTGSEKYYGKCITSVQVPGGQTVRLPLQ